MHQTIKHCFTAHMNLALKFQNFVINLGDKNPELERGQQKNLKTVTNFKIP